MRALVFGAQGMLGRTLVARLENVGVEVVSGLGDISNPEDVNRAFAEVRTDVVVNCAGIVKSECLDEARALAVNAHAPHLLADAAERHGARFVHISTDCVFSGRCGAPYVESDWTDAEDLYGQTKAIGEVADRKRCLTLRTSFIGHDPRRHRGLLEWLLASTGTVPGWTHALWSGLSVPELARAIVLAINVDLEGLYHVAGPEISKADLLEVLVRELKLNLHVERVPGEAIDRRLDGSKFKEATGYSPPNWNTMAEELSR